MSCMSCISCISNGNGDCGDRGGYLIPARGNEPTRNPEDRRGAPVHCLDVGQSFLVLSSSRTQVDACMMHACMHAQIQGPQ
jgi:hypothetical protein